MTEVATIQARQFFNEPSGQYQRMRQDLSPGLISFGKVVTRDTTPVNLILQGRDLFEPEAAKAEQERSQPVRKQKAAVYRRENRLSEILPEEKIDELERTCFVSKASGEPRLFQKLQADGFDRE